jgi:carboxyl-terminal processing protease
MDLDTFVLTYSVPQDLIDTYVSESKLDNMSSDQKELLANYLKALVAQQLFDDLGYYRVDMANDPMIKKVLELESQQGKDILPL